MAVFLKKEETNWNRACRLLTEAGTELLILFLQDVWSRTGYASLDHFLAANKATLDREAAKGILHDTQMDILYPASGWTETDQWDITLVSCVVNNCIPKTMKTSLENAAINGIRDLRNMIYGHGVKMKMDDKEFTQNWADIQKRLSVAARDLNVSPRTSLQARVDRIENEQIVDGKDLENTIQAWKACDIALFDVIQQVGEEQKELKTMMTEERCDTSGMKTLLEERSSHDKDMKTMMTEERRDTSKMKTLLEERTYQDRDMKIMMTEARQETSEMKTLFDERTQTMMTELRDIKTRINEDTSRPVKINPHSFSEGVAHSPKRNLVDAAVQMECTASDLGTEAEATLPEEFRALQSGLMDYYKSIFTLPTGVGSLFDEVDIDEIYVEPCLVLVDHTASTKEKAKENEKNISLNDIFLDNSSRCRQIYVSADAGNGKTSLCKRIVKDWCSVHLQDHLPDDAGEISSLKQFHQSQLTDDPGEKCTLKQFHFLFYISLRKTETTQYDINEMIVSQLLYKNPYIKQAKCTNDKSGELLDEVFGQYSERCLVVVDGLDEWTAPRKSKYPSVSNGVPGRNPHLKYTILTTARPWKLEVLRLRSSEIDRQVELRGVKSVDEFVRKLVDAHNKKENTDKSYRLFECELDRTGVQKLEETPILLKQLISLWHNDQPFGKSKTEVYTNMVELLLKLAEKREDFTELQRGHYKFEEVATPACFKNVERCERYKYLLISIGKLAFETLFCPDKETQLVFESSEAKKSGLHESDVDLCLTVGILTQSIIPDKTWERKSLSFLHKTFHEYFAALYLSVFGNRLNDIKTRIGSKCKSLDNLCDMEDLFVFLSGMCPTLMKDVYVSLVPFIDNATKMDELRLQIHDDPHNYPLQSPFSRIQSMKLACYKESSDNAMDPVFLPVTDIVNGFWDRYLSHECLIVRDCLQKDPSELRSIIWKGRESPNELDDNLQRAMPVENLEGANLEDLRNVTYHLNLSNYHNLTYFHVQYINVRSVTLSPSIRKITMRDIYTLSHDGMCSLMSSISDNHSLESIDLDSVKCRKDTTGEGCRCVMDLSGHSELRKLKLHGILLDSVTLSSTIRDIVMTNIHIMSHDGMCSLMSSISNDHSLEYITLDSVMCRDHTTGERCMYVMDLFGHSEHTTGEGCRCVMDLFGHSELRKLALYCISFGSLTLSSTIRDITMRHIDILSHEDMCSLMSSISNNHSLEYITLDSVMCRDHTTGERCRYVMDLSGHSELRKLMLQDISLDSVTLSSTIRDIKMRNIHTLSHDGMCSLMSSISNNHSLESVYLDSVKCRDNTTGERCRYVMGLSGCSELKKLDLRHISLDSVTLSLTSRDIYMKDIHTLSHDGMCSLMSSISDNHSLESITLDSVKCRDHTTGERCRYVMGLSGCSELKKLDLRHISLDSVTLSSTIRDIVMLDIDTLSHDGMCSLMSSISNNHSLESVYLDSVKCRDYTTGERCRYVMDLSGCSELKKLDLRHISLDSVTLSSTIRDIVMLDINTLSHDGMCSLMSSISNNHSLESVRMLSVKCREHTTGEKTIFVMSRSGCGEPRYYPDDYYLNHINQHSELLGQNYRSSLGTQTCWLDVYKSIHSEHLGQLTGQCDVPRIDYV